MDLFDKGPELEPKLAKICIEIGNWIKSQKNELSPDEIESKGHNDLVSYVDREAETQLVKKLQELFPAGVITEEDITQNRVSEYTWIIDPLDGTTNFIHGLPAYAVSVALKYEEQYVLAAVAEPNMGEVFTAYKGGGARMNGSTIKVSDTPVLKDSLLATGFPYQDFSQLGSYLELLNRLLYETRGVRRFGSAALDLVYTAIGRFDAFYEYGLKEWDVAAGSLIVEEAGGIVSSWENTSNYAESKTILATNGHIHEMMLKSIRKVFG